MMSPTHANPAAAASTLSDDNARSPGNTAHTSSPAAPESTNLTASSSTTQPRARNTRKNNSTHESTNASGTARALTASWTTPRNTPSSATLTTPSASTLHKPSTPATYAPSLPLTNSRTPRERKRITPQTKAPRQWQHTSTPRNNNCNAINKQLNATPIATAQPRSREKETPCHLHTKAGTARGTTSRNNGIDADSGCRAFTGRYACQTAMGAQTSAQDAHPPPARSPRCV